MDIVNLRSLTLAKHSGAINKGIPENVNKGKLFFSDAVGQAAIFFDFLFQILIKIDHMLAGIQAIG